MIAAGASATQRGWNAGVRTCPDVIARHYGIDRSDRGRQIGQKLVSDQRAGDLAPLACRVTTTSWWEG
jgi:hypothetical protein